MSSQYQRQPDELIRFASFFWPAELSLLEAERSVIPRLVETQDAFIAILSVEVDHLDNLFQIVDASSMAANLFVKHLVVLADFGGEMLQRVSQQFKSLFPDGVLEYTWHQNGRTETRHYHFQVMPAAPLSNHRLGLSGKQLTESHPLSALQQDVIALLLLGNASTDADTAHHLAKCEIGSYVGRPKELDTFIRQRYLWVSRITGGAQSNTLGQLAQRFVRDYLRDNYPGKNDLQYRMNAHIPGVTHTGAGDARETSFDLVITDGRRFIAVEISFQVTTNSVIERKAGQAQARQQQIHALGHKIAYVLDGAGNFRRDAAMRTLCTFSDCTVAFSHAELDVLCQFIRETFEGET
jgi:hypothetical protein